MLGRGPVPMPRASRCQRRRIPVSDRPSSNASARIPIRPLVGARILDQRILGWPNPRGSMTADALKIARRDHADRGRGRARAITADQVAEIVAIARKDGRMKDAAIAGVLFQGRVATLGSRGARVARHRTSRRYPERALDPGALQEDRSDRRGNRYPAGQERRGRRARRDPPGQCRAHGLGVRPQPAIHRPPLRRRRPRRRHRRRHRAFRADRPCRRIGRSRRVHNRNHAVRRMEDGPHGRALRRRREGRTRRGRSNTCSVRKLHPARGAVARLRQGGNGARIGEAAPNPAAPGRFLGAFASDGPCRCPPSPRESASERPGSPIRPFRLGGARNERSGAPSAAGAPAS